MDTKKLDDLNANPKNPRRINEHEFNALKKSIKEFGDLSGIILNTRTNQLVGGHQRVQAFKALADEKKVVITQKFDPPTKTGTTAVGYVTHDNEFYGYREVDWDEGRENAANIAANRISGEWDLDLLAEVNHEIAQLEEGAALLELTGQTEKELSKLNKMIGVEDEETPPEDESEGIDKKEHLEFALTTEMREVVEEALENIKATKDLLVTENASRNGAALYWLCRDWLDRLHKLKDDKQDAPVQE